MELKIKEKIGKKYNNKGVTLMTLVISIIVMLTISSVVILTTVNNAPIEKANEAVVRSDYKNIKEKWQEEYTNLIYEHLGRKEDVTHEELQTIIPEEYKEELVATKEGIVYVGEDEIKKEIAKEVGIKIEYTEEIQKNDAIAVKILESVENRITVEIITGKIEVKEIEFFVSEDGVNWISKKSEGKICEFTDLKDFTIYQVRMNVTTKDNEIVESKIYSVKTKMKEFEAANLELKKVISEKDYEIGKWSNEDIGVKILEVENAKTVYEVTGANKINSTNSESILTKDGISNIKVTTTKYEEHVRTREYEVKIDKTEPQITELISDASNITQNDIVVTGKAKDNLSGIVAYQFSTNDSLTEESEGWNIIENTKNEIAKTQLVTENNTYYFYVKDEAGNVVKKEIVIDNIDKNKPTNTAPTLTATSNSIEVKVEQKDENKIEKIEIQVKETGSDTWEEWIEVNKETYVIEGLDMDVSYDVRTRVTDEAGNFETSEVSTVTTEKLEKPEITAPTNITNQDVTVTIKYPSSSGVVTNEYSIDGETWIPVTGSTQEVMVSTNYTTVYARIVDSTGQTSETATYEVTCIDKDVPTLNSISVASPQAGEYTAGQVVTITATYSENITGTAPVLKIKFGESKEREITNGKISGNTITYTYEITGDDYGILTSTGYEGKVNDLVGNEITVSNIALTGNNITAYTESVLQVFEKDGTEAFHGADYKPKISKVKFVDRINVPENVTSWDVSNAGNGSVMAYVEDNGSGGYVLTIVGNGKIYANEDSSYLFYNFTALTEIENLSLLDTSRVTIMKSMFNHCMNLTSLDVSNFNTNNVKNMEFMFQECSSLTSLDVRGFDTSNVKYMNCMFRLCNNLKTLDVSNFNTSNVIGMNSFFNGCNGLISLDVSSFNTSKVNDMSFMFSGCNELTTIDVSNWDTGSVTSMDSMFRLCNNLKTLDVSNFNTSQVTDMANMFNDCNALTILNVSNFNTSKVTNMNGMFRKCNGLISLDVSNFNTSQVTDMANMFNGCNSLANIDVSNFDTENVTSMETMFFSCMMLTNLNVSNFDTSNVINMQGMFNSCNSLTSLDLSKWNTSRVTTMRSMFNRCNALISLNVSNFNTSNVTEMIRMFYYCRNLKNLDLSNFDTSKVTNKMQMFEGCEKLEQVILGDKFNFLGEMTGIIVDEEVTGTDYLPVPNSEYILGATGKWYNTAGFGFTPENVPNNVSDTYITTPPESVLQTFTEDSTVAFHSVDYKPKITKIKFASSINVPSDVTAWDVSESGNGSVMAYVESDGNNGYILTIAGNGKIYANSDSSHLFYNFTALNEIENIALLDTSRATTLRKMFMECSSLINLDVSKFNTNNVKIMSYMFNNCKLLTSIDVSNWNTSNVTSIDFMFKGCSGLTTLDVSKWNISKVTNIDSVFSGCKNITNLDVSNWDTSNVKNMNAAFEECSKLTSIDVSKWNTNNAVHMYGVFKMCSNLTSLDVSNWNTSKVVTIYWMFEKCGRLTNLDVSKWDTSKVTSMAGVFYGCSSLTSLDVSNWNTNNVTSLSQIFVGCNNLTTLNLNKWDTSKATSMSSMFVNCFKLQQVTLGEKFSFLGDGSITTTTQYLPTPSNSYIPRADGEWYNAVTGKNYTSENIPNNTAATYTAIPVEFAITYNLDGGVNPSDTLENYKYSTTDITLPIPTKDGYIFEGWYETSDFSGSVITTIPSGSYGNKEYFAKWREMSTTLTIGVNFRNTIPNKATAIVFTDKKAPSGASLTDVSQAGDTGVVAWLDGTTYKVSTQRSGKQIIANENCKRLFGYSESDAEYATKPNITSIDMTNLNINNVTDMSYMFSYQELTNLVFPQNFNTGKVTTMHGMFRNVKLTSLDYIVTSDGFITDNVTLMDYMFYGCSNLISLDLSKFNTSKVTDMEYMFERCISLKSLDVSKFYTSSVINMQRMFYNCTSLIELNTTNWDTSKVISFERCFEGCNNLEVLDVSNWDTGTATSMCWMFAFCKKLTTLNVSNFNTSNVTNMGYMFYNCQALTSLGVDNFDTSKVTTMYHMFANCRKLEKLDLSKWNTSNVNSMGYMFNQCDKLSTLNISSFNTSNVTHMGYMFSNCQALTNVDVSNFNTSKVEKMYFMFNNCYLLKKLDLSSFDTSKVTSKINMFTYCKKLEEVKLSDKFSFLGEMTTTISGQDITGTDYLPVPDGGYMLGANGKWYNTEGKAFIPETIPNNVADTYVTIPPESVLQSFIQDSTVAFHGADYKPKITKVKFANEINVPSGVTAWDVSEAGNGSVMAYVEDDGNNGYILTMAGYGKIYANVDSSHLFLNFTALTEIENIALLDTSRATSLRKIFTGCNKLVNLDLKSFNTTNVTNMSYMFYNCQALTSLDVSSFNTAKVTHMGNMFNNCQSLTSLNLNHFDTSNVTSMYNMFENCKNLVTLNVSSWKTNLVTDMSFMFRSCNNLKNIDIGGWNTIKVTDMRYMFNGCNNLISLNVSNFDTSKVINMYCMFYNCAALTSLDVSSFNTAKVTNMGYMFNNCQSLTSLDLNHFDTSNVTSMYNMFENCKNLVTLNVSSWNTNLVTDMSFMFSSCNNLKNIDIGGWNTVKVTDMRYMFNGCNNLISLNVSNFDTSKVEDMSYMFHYCYALTSLNTTNWNVAKVKDFSRCFEGCTSLTVLDVSKWDTSSATSMYWMFAYCEKLTTINVSNFNTANVTSMGYMFHECKSVTELDVSNFNTSNVTHMGYMFYNCNSLTSLDVSGFDTSIVEKIYYMFAYCSNLTSLDVSRFNTSNAKNMEGMFMCCIDVNSLDVSNFDTSKVTNMKYMFYDCNKITELHVSKFNTSQVTDMYGQFVRCYVLKTLDLSKWDTSQVTDMTYMFISCHVLTTEVPIYGNGVTSYTEMFKGAATISPAKITVNYTAETSALVDLMIATKSANSNVVKATTPTTMPAVFTLNLDEVEEINPEVANVTVTVNKDTYGITTGIYLVAEEESGIDSITIVNSSGNVVNEITLNGETTYSSLLDITESGTYTVNLVTNAGKTKQMTFEI